jgi:hypothetical protein
MVLLLTSLSLCSNIFARRSPPEPIPSAQVPTVHVNAIGVPARHRLIFRPQTILIRRQRVSTTRRALFSWRCRVLLRRQRVLNRGSSLPFLSILPSRYLASRIVHLIYAPTLPARTWRACTLGARTQSVLLHPYIFLPFSWGFSWGLYLTAISHPRFASYPKDLARLRASMYHSLDRLQEAQALLRD